MSGGKSLAARCQLLHAAAECGSPAAARRLDRLSRAGQRAGQCCIDLVMDWHRHPGRLDPCDDPGCAEASDGAAWAAAWELYWPPGHLPA
jgi:hypothetical protein